MPRGPKPEDLTGQKFNKLTILEYSHTRNGRRYVKCQCECGNITVTRKSAVKTGHTRSCGCAIKEHPNRYKPPKGSWTGPKNPNWNGGQYTTADGYVFIKKPNHPNADSRGYVREHVLVMSDILGRPLDEGEVVHHINGDPGDNRPENLAIMGRDEHASEHHQGLMKPNSLANLEQMTSERAQKIWDTTRAHERAKPKTCDNCGGEFYRSGKPKYRHTFCSPGCYREYRRNHPEEYH